jgi:prepilin-type N-terminal cleavage/methylation domain-containing protein
MVCHRDRRFVCGFTLVELLVVLAIIGVLTALLLPAVQMAREFSRRASCANNVREIGRGLTLFHDAQGALPPGAVFGSSGDAAAVRKKFSIAAKTDHGWGQFLLPFIEQKALYQQYHWEFDWRAPENELVREAALQVFTCSSVPNGAQGKRQDGFTSGGFTWRAAAGDYSITNGLNYQRLRPLNLVDDYGLPKSNSNRRTLGVMRPNEVVNFSQITDGLSYTTWITEDAGRPAIFRSGGKFVSPTGNAGAGWADKDNYSILDGYNSTSDLFNGPCPINCTNKAEIYSFHPGGAMIVMGDGATRFLSELISIEVVARMITRKGRDPRHEF